MSNIKIRVWEKTEKQYITYPFGWISIFDNPDCLEIKDDEYLVIEQYTGLSDRNGKEIYAGDIVRFYIKSPIYDGKITTLDMPVEWDNEMAGFSPFCDHVFMENRDTYEAIGNIHENGGLLK